MSFQAYIDNIKAKTGKSPEDFYEIAKSNVLVGEGITATQIVNWLKKDFDLGHGHAMCIFAVFKEKGWVVPPGKAKKM